MTKLDTLPPMATTESKAEEIIKKTEVDNTPFIIITINGKSFGTLGKYRITEEYHTIEQCKTELEKITWNRLIQTILLVNEIINENKK